MLDRTDVKRTAVLPLLPYGRNEVDPDIVCVSASPKRVRCFIRGCRHTVATPGRGVRGEACPEHDIRCHHSSAGGTYVYPDVRRNIIASPEQFVRRIVGHPFKYESHRLGAERSEDALSWNVFRSLQEAGRLNDLARLITGDASTIEPFLYLWGICTTDDDFTPWDLLVSARQRFESNLPVVRPNTEPDIALHLPGRYLILIEAKFTSANTSYGRGPRQNGQSLTLDELLGLYQDPELKMLCLSKATSADHIYHQLWRNTIFAEWMAKADHPRTKPYHVNLVRQGYDADSADEFEALLNPGFEDQFQQITWEWIYRSCTEGSAMERLRRYLQTKTAGLKPAFQLG
jgi:hypothetical protein